MIDLAAYENKLRGNLERLLLKINSSAWFEEIEVGTAYVTPKRQQFAGPPSDQIRHVGLPAPQTSPEYIDTQLRLDPNIEHSIIETLFLWQFGPALELLLGSECLGYRLQLRDDEIPREGRWLFEYWPPTYEEFRTAPLAAANKTLDFGRAVILSADFKTFYDTIDPTFLISDSFLSSLQAACTAAGRSLDFDEFLLATRSLLRSIASFRRAAARLTGQKWHTGIPIGAISSRLIANLALAPFDQAVLKIPGVTCYRRYVDDFVIVAYTDSRFMTMNEVVAQYLPTAVFDAETIRLSGAELGRPGSELTLSGDKTKAHILQGDAGREFLNVIRKDFATLVSTRREFLDSSALSADFATRLLRVGNDRLGTLRVLRDADRTKLEHFSLSNTLRDLERIALLLNNPETQEIASPLFEKIEAYLASREGWVEDIELVFRLIRLAASIGDPAGLARLCAYTDGIWGSVKLLKSGAGTLRHRGRSFDRRTAWQSLQRYLDARRFEIIASAIPPMPVSSGTKHVPDEGLRVGNRKLDSNTIHDRAKSLASADLRYLDREDDRFYVSCFQEESDGLETSELYSGHLAERFELIRKFTFRSVNFDIVAWRLPPHKLFLLTRPPTYFDIAQVWLTDVEQRGFRRDEFSQLLRIVNAVRGNHYVDPVARVIDSSTVDFRSQSHAFIKPEPDVRLMLGNLANSEKAYNAAAARDGAPSITVDRLLALARILGRASMASKTLPLRINDRALSNLLVLPELSLPRRWFRSVANHVARMQKFSLVVGLEYLHDPDECFVRNQVFAVFPGPYSTVATWPWTKRLPAREEARRLAGLTPPLTFPPPFPDRKRTVIRSDYADFSVLICSEMIETARITDLLGRVQLVLIPAWNQDTASYDHLVKTVGFQLHSIIAVANNGHYSDCRTWAPYGVRWKQECCRLIERDLDDIIVADIPTTELRALHRAARSGIPVAETKERGKWLPLPPGFEVIE